MNLLLDTHAFIWYVEGFSELSDRARNQIENIQNQCFISIASLWEMSIKVGLGKLNLKGSFNNALMDIETNGFEILPISFLHTLRNTAIPWHHRDPFDRLLVAQAIEENMSIISRDEMFDLYFDEMQVKRIW